MAEPPHKKKKRSSSASGGIDIAAPSGSVSSLFGGGAKIGEDLSSTFNRLFANSAPDRRVGNAVSAALATASRDYGGREDGGRTAQRQSSQASAPATAAATAAAKTARRLLAAAGAKAATATSNTTTAATASTSADGNAGKKAGEHGKVGTKAGMRFPKLDAAERRERDLRTLFVGNVPLSWDKKRLRSALRTAVPNERYSGAFKPIWFRSEPLKEEYGATMMRKVGSMRGEYAKYASDAKNAYILLESAEDVAVVKKAAQGLEADKDHVLRFDGVGEGAKMAQFDRKRSVFVGNLPSDTSEADLRKVFASVGNVDAVRIVRDRWAKACKGIAFVRFKERSSVKPALDLWDSEVRGRPIRVMKIERPEDEAAPSAGHPAARRIQMRAEKRHRSRIRKATAAVSQAAGKNKKRKSGKIKKKVGMGKMKNTA